MSEQHKFTDSERAGVYRAIYERRDMRHFTSQAIDTDVLARLLKAAHQAPSVGLMQPWRIIRITRPERRQQIAALVEQERLATAEALNERSDEFLKLKVEGIDRCAEVLVVALMDKRDQHIFGRRTLPEMDLASVACAIQNMWLAARAEGLGMGWVSLFDPSALAQLLSMPKGAKPVAVLCLGHVDEFYEKPMLALEGWREPEPLECYLGLDQWPQDETNV